MRIKDLDFYVLFTFCDVNNDEICYTTSDKNILNEFMVNGNPMSSFTIGDMIEFPPQKQKYKIVNIQIRRLIDDTDEYSFGVDKDVSDLIGDFHIPIFSILVSIEEV